MYGVPPDLDLSIFIGLELNQIRLGPFDLQFHFSSPSRSAAITVEGSWTLTDGTGTIIDESDGRVGNPPGNRSKSGWKVRDLLADTVTAGQVGAPTSFTLEFASGRRLTILDDSNEFESFSIQPGDVFV